MEHTSAGGLRFEERACEEGAGTCYSTEDQERSEDQRSPPPGTCPPHQKRGRDARRNLQFRAARDAWCVGARRPQAGRCPFEAAARRGSNRSKVVYFKGKST